MLLLSMCEGFRPRRGPPTWRELSCFRVAVLCECEPRLREMGGDMVVICFFRACIVILRIR